MEKKRTKEEQVLSYETVLNRFKTFVDQHSNLIDGQLQETERRLGKWVIVAPRQLININKIIFEVGLTESEIDEDSPLYPDYYISLFVNDEPVRDILWEVDEGFSERYGAGEFSAMDFKDVGEFIDFLSEFESHHFMSMQA